MVEVDGPAALVTGAKSGPSDAGASPMIAQYQRLKAQHADALLFFRMGDFYELFFEDAVAAAPALEIALTRRGQHAGQDIAMCGVPVHSADLYLQRLIKRGFKVAVCEQLEDPAEARKRAGRTLVRRDVVRVVTPGTLTEEALLDARRHNHLAALAATHDGLGLAWLDVSTGLFMTQACAAAELASAVARLAPSELLIAERLAAGPLRAALDPELTLTRLADAAFDSVRAEARLTQMFKVAALDALGAFERSEIAAAGALLDYLELTQKGLLPHLDRPRRVEAGAMVQIDAATRRNLELVQTLAGARDGSLLATVDLTSTGAGARLLASRLGAPLTSPEAIGARLEAVTSLVVEPERRAQVRDLLKRCPELERALSRLALGRGGPRDLLAVAEALERAATLRGFIAGEPALAAVHAGLVPPAGLGQHLRASLVEQPPVLTRDGGFVPAGASAAIDEQRGLRDDGRHHILALEARYRRETGIASLKVRSNNLIGWYLEIPASQQGNVPAAFIQRQSMAGATRYTTAELAELASRIAAAAEEVLRLELALFEALRAAVLAASDAVASVARGLAELDVTAALAELAATRRWARPVIDGGQELRIEGGRHPVVEAAVTKAGGQFVANSCDLGPDSALWLLTGPNMAGKSTFLRQNALIVLLAQAGSYVPATAARIGVVDRIFSRVGAADDLARGRSTFMVEMVETAAILNQAGPRSFVILDEIGRGTATYDGLSLAWAVIEHLHEVNRCRGLFATHYHELTALAAKLPRLCCHALRIKEWQGEVVFMHEVVTGSADRSYGIHVARLAGLPAAAVARAEQVLGQLEAGEARSATARLADDLPLFAAATGRSSPRPAVEPSAVERLIAGIDADRLSPRDALDLVYELKKTLQEPSHDL